MSKKIIGLINKKTGEVTVSTEGYDGPACKEATKWIEQKLGFGADAKEELTQEFYNTTTNEQETTA